VPTATFLSGYLINSILTSALLAVLVAMLGRVVYGVAFPSAHVLAAVVTVLVGAFACCAGIRHHGPDPQVHHRHRASPGRHLDPVLAVRL
jgi:archaellum biogenesis protein FlaJ (TadC family)